MGRAGDSSTFTATKEEEEEDGECVNCSESTDEEEGIGDDGAAFVLLIELL